VEMVRFVSSGTEACLSVLRLMRAYTKREKVLKFVGCYHGHADSFLVKAGSGARRGGAGRASERAGPPGACLRRGGGCAAAAGGLLRRSAASRRAAHLLKPPRRAGVITLGLPDSPGVPQSTAAATLTATYNDLESVRGFPQLQCCCCCTCTCTCTAGAPACPGRSTCSQRSSAAAALRLTAASPPAAARRSGRCLPPTRARSPA
jgi:hypothetical protein